MIATSTGVYGNTEYEFFNKIIMEGVDVFIDIRQRRGMRGSKYKFVNSLYLQNKLRELGVQYKYIRDLAPPTYIRIEQKLEDDRNNNAKSSRVSLGDKFIEMYKKDIVDKFDFSLFIEEMRGKKVLFFCVEEHHHACHRSLVLEKMASIGITCYYF